MKKILFTLALLVSVAGVANATAIYTDTYDAGHVKMRGSLFGSDDSVSWQFNLLNDGYNPANEVITSATVGLNLQDDGGWFDWFEFAKLDLGSNSFTWEVDTGTRVFTVGSLMVLSTTGLLDVTLTATLGDFYFNSATLTAEAKEVPEPSIIALMGLGLIGFGLGRRRQV